MFECLNVKIEAAVARAHELAEELELPCEPYWYLNKTVKNIQAVVTTKPEGDQWAVCTWRSDMTGKCFDDHLYNSLESAEEKAREYASEQGLVFVKYNTPFLTVAKVEGVYQGVMMTFCGGDPLFGAASFEFACSFASIISRNGGIPFEPHWFIERV